MGFLMKYFKNLSISIKLILLMMFVLLISIIPISFKTLSIFESNAQRSAEETNLNTSLQKNMDFESMLNNWMLRGQSLSQLYLQDLSNPTEQSLVSLESIFALEKDIMAFEIYEVKYSNPVLLGSKFNTKIWKQNSFSVDWFNQLKKEKNLAFVKVAQAKNLLDVMLDQKTKQAILVFAFPVSQNEKGEILNFISLYIPQSVLQSQFVAKGTRQIFLANSEGSLLAHNNKEHIFSYSNYSEHLAIKRMLSEDSLRRQFKYIHPSNQETYMAAYAKNNMGYVSVSEVSEKSVLINARLARKQAIYITQIMISLMILIVFFFSVSLTKPIENLVSVTQQIAKGNFDIQITNKHTAKDEVGTLALAMEDMLVGLKERDKVKNLFNKFHGSSVTEEMLNAESMLGGQKKNVSVFFSDLRGFTEFSEGHSPEEVVKMLNEYFAIMVKIINENHGVVDKFIGDAIMAVWGAPKSSGQDAYYAVKASLEMRLALQKLNEKRLSENLKAISIGIGIHTGEAISGTIGSDDRMEFTVIGDTVNQSSRIEASTKAFGVDLLISKETFQQVQEQFVIELAGKAEVKGKAEALELYKVLGFVNADGSHNIIKTEYSDYDKQAADKVKIAV